MTDSSRRHPVGGTVKAAHAARSRGDRLLAATLFLEAHQPFEAAVCFYEADDKQAALKSFLLVPEADRRYRRACVQAVRVGCELGELGYELDQFLRPFLETGPSTEEELAAVYELAAAHENDHTPDVAGALWATLVQAAPRYRDAGARLRNVEALFGKGDRTSGMEEHVSFWRPRPSPHRTSWPAQAARSSTIPPAKGDAPAADDEVLISVSGFAGIPASGGPGATSDSGPRIAAGDEPLPDQASGAKPSIFEVRRPWTDPKERKIEPPSAPESTPGGRSVLEQGSLVAGRYRIEGELGRGGMGVVYRATDLELSHEVALKLLSIATGQGDMLRRFKQELTLCRQISHPNVIRLYDIGAHGDYKFISMELLAGESLRRKLRDGIKLSKAMKYLRQICAGLEAIHGLGIVHRDVKPDNVFVGDDDVLKLMDFGLAKSLRAASAGAADPLTKTGFLAGTPGFMAPEQFTSFGTVTEQADLYSLGVLAYQLLTGVRPFQGTRDATILELQLTTVPEPPSKRMPRLTPKIDAVILKMLQKDPGSRPSARDLGAAVAETSR